MIDQICIRFPGFCANVYEVSDFFQGDQFIIECHVISQCLFPYTCV